MKVLAEQIAELDSVAIYGRVVGVHGLMVEVAGPIQTMSVGARVVIDTGTRRDIPREVAGFSGSNALLMPPRSTRQSRCTGRWRRSWPRARTRRPACRTVNAT
jgi:flagellar biosynthesis/type III secretory pathway ATPase